METFTTDKNNVEVKEGDTLTIYFPLGTETGIVKKDKDGKLRWFSSTMPKYVNGTERKLLVEEFTGKTCEKK